MPLDVCKSLQATSLVEEASAVKMKHAILLSQDGACHREFNSNHVFSEDDISVLSEFSYTDFDQGIVTVSVSFIEFETHVHIV